MISQIENKVPNAFLKRHNNSECIIGNAGAHADLCTLTKWFWTEMQPKVDK